MTRTPTAAELGLIVTGEGDWAVLEGKRLSLFASREQAMAYCGFLIKLGLKPSLWSPA